MKDKNDLARQIGKRLKDLRKQARLTLKQVAKDAGLSSPLLSRLENGQTMPSIQTLQLIASSLKTDIGFFFNTEESRSYVLSRKGERKVSHSERGAKGKVTYDVEQLAEGFDNPYMEPIIATIVARDHKGFDAISHGGQEVLYVIEGKIELTLGEDKFIMSEGDGAYYDGDVPHKAISLSKKPAKTFNVHFIPGKRVGTFLSHD
jgi:transcriptional regulator with XRE-family HTH domain